MMTKKLIILLACLGLAFSTGCTSKDSKEDAEVTSDVDSADLENLEGVESLEVTGDEAIESDSLAEDALGETGEIAAESEAPATTEAPPKDVATTESLPSDPFAESTTTTTDSSTTIVDAAEPSEPTSMFEETTRTETQTTTTTGESEEAPKATVPLQKVATTPWKVGKVWANTVYFARPGDSLSSISTMIYGSDKSKELKKINPTYQSRSVKPGDKVYYNSPHRPEDSARIITYYEDNGLAPDVYVAKEGDNIRAVSKDILGYEGAWKEVWSSNSVDSKGEIPAGTELRYWKGGVVAQAPSQELGAPTEQAPPPPPQDMAQVSPPPPPVEQMPPPDMAQNELPPPPMPEQEMVPPPPPQDMAQMPPPPPPPPEVINPPAPAAAGEETPTGMDNDTTMALGIVGLAAAGLAILMVVRKKRRQRELEQSMNETHVG